MTRRGGCIRRVSAASISAPPITTMASGRCVCAPIPCESAAGNKPIMATSVVIMPARRRFCAAERAAASMGSPPLRSCRKYVTISSASCTAMPKMEMKPIAAETDSSSRVTSRARMPPVQATGIEISTIRVAAEHRELHRRVAPAVLATDHVRTVLGGDGRQLAERDAAAVRRRHGDAPERGQVAAVLWQPAHGEREALLAVEDLRHRLPADGGLHHRLDVARIEPVAFALRPVGDDLDARLPHRADEAEVVDAPHLAHHLDHLLGEAVVRLHLGPCDLHAVLALYARERFLDVVGDVLREIEDHAGELVLQLLLEDLRQLVLVEAVLPLAFGPERGEER